MILLNGKQVVLDHFSDGTLSIKESVPREYGNGRSATLTWTFENDEETVALYFLTRHLQEHGVEDVRLVMPYIPNARKDRCRTDADVFTLKYFAELLNSLRFTSVTVLDPHSMVSEALIDRLVVRTARENIAAALEKIGREDTVLFFPDEGAMKRYAAMTERPYVFGMKKRDPATRQILEMQVMGTVKELTGKPILMVDDICSSGKTLLYAAGQLKDKGVGDIYLYVSHCENIALQSPLVTTDLVKRIYTTGSFLRETHPKIVILDF